MQLYRAKPGNPASLFIDMVTFFYAKSMFKSRIKVISSDMPHYSLSNCTISSWNDLNRSNAFLGID